METKPNRILKNMIWVALATGLILLVPLVAMQFTNQVVWTLSDFVIAGILLFGMGTLMVVAARIMPKYRLISSIVLAVLLIYIWAELAVGIFTNWGS